MKTKPKILLVGLCVCAVCALYPPRRAIKTPSDQFQISGARVAPLDEIPHCFVFSKLFDIYKGADDTVFPVELDSGWLLAELALIGSITGILALSIKGPLCWVDHAREEGDTISEPSASADGKLGSVIDEASGI